MRYTIRFKSYSILFLIFLTSCVILSDYTPVSSSNYSIFDKTIVYSSYDLTIRTEGGYHFNEFHFYNDSFVNIKVKSKFDTLILYFDDVNFRDVVSTQKVLVDTSKIPY